MNLDNVISNLNSTLSELERSGIPVNEIETIKFHLLNARKVTNEVTARLAPDILNHKIMGKVHNYRTIIADEDEICFNYVNSPLSICISNSNYQLLVNTPRYENASALAINYITELKELHNVTVFPVNKLSDDVIAIVEEL